ncbi:hypothetical protein HYS93_02445 [Candidatus Daviesbacteria bacterium]|nr:hypothetical protein [Candidatus Daviesbacteria bacterium]
MINQKGIAHLLLLVLIVVILGVGLFLFYSKGSFKIPGFSNLVKQEPKVAVKTEYKNPFKKENQYVNPFDEYKSPFLTFEQK